MVETLNKQYKAAINRGYTGSFKEFAAAHNSFLTERSRNGSKAQPTEFLNDTGTAVAEQPIQQPVYQQPIHETREVPMYQQPVAQQPRIQLPDVREDEDDNKIWGIKKPLFYGGVAVIVLLVLAGVWYFVFRKPKAANGGQAAAQANSETAAAAEAQAGNSTVADTGAATGNNTAAAASGAGNTAAAAQ